MSDAGEFAQSMLSSIAKAFGVPFDEMSQDYAAAEDAAVAERYSMAREHMLMTWRATDRMCRLVAGRAFALMTAPKKMKARMNSLLSSRDGRRRRRGHRMLDHQVMRNKLPSIMVSIGDSIEIFPRRDMQSRPVRAIIADEPDFYSGPLGETYEPMSIGWKTPNQIIAAEKETPDV